MCALISFLWVTLAIAVQNHDPAIQNDKIQEMKPEQTEQVSKDAPTISEKALDLKNQQDRINYAIGVNLIGNFKHQGIEIDLNYVIKGMQDALSGGILLLTDTELRKATMQYQTEVRQRQAKARIAAAEATRKEENANR